MDPTAPVIEFITRDDGTKLLRDRLGAEVDLSKAERKLEEHGWELKLSRPSQLERARRDAIEAREPYARFRLTNTADEPVELLLLGKDYGTHRFTMTQRETTLGDCVDSLQVLLADYSLL